MFQHAVILRELEEALRSQILSCIARLGRSHVVINGKQVDVNDPNLRLDQLITAGLDLRLAIVILYFTLIM